MDEYDGLSLRPGDAEMAARIAWLATRRPRHFRPWENIRPDGCCLSDAILELTLPSFRPNVQELLADEEIGFRERSAVLRDYLWSHILWRLQQGHLFVRGLVFATGEDWRSEPRMFDDAVPNFALNRITCIGRTYGAVRVFDVQKFYAERFPLADTVPINGTGGPIPDPAVRAADWMKEHVITRVANQRDDRIGECAKALGITRAVAKAGWNTLPEEIRGYSRRAK